MFVADVQHLLLCRSNFSGAANTAECLLLLSRALPWKTAVATTIRQNLEGKPEVHRLVAGSRLAASAQRKLDWSYPEAGNPVRVSSFSCRKWIWGRSSACWSVQGSPRYVSRELLLCTFRERVSLDAHSSLGRAVSCARLVWRKGPLELCSPVSHPPEEVCKDLQWTSQPENLKQ